MDVEISEFVLSPLCPWAGNCQLLLDQAAPNETFCEEEMKWCFYKTKPRYKTWKINTCKEWRWCHLDAGRGAQCTADSFWLDCCMWIESSLSLRAKQKDKWQSTTVEREGGITQLVLRWVASFRRGRCSKCLKPWRKGVDVGLVEFSSINLHYWNRSDETTAISHNTWCKLLQEKKNGGNF